MSLPVQVRRGTKAELESYGNLSIGELGYTTDEQLVYIGTGNFNVLVGGVTSSGGNPSGIGAAGQLYLDNQTLGLFVSDGTQWQELGYPTSLQLQTTSGDLTSFVNNQLSEKTHSSLVGLDNDDHPQYLRVDGGHVVSGTLVPDMTGASGIYSVHSIGSPTQRFLNMYAESVHIGESSLYVNGTQLVYVDPATGTITISADTDQGILMKTTGLGTLSYSSDAILNMGAKGGVQFDVPATKSYMNMVFSNESSRGGIAFSASGLHGYVSMVAYELFEIIAEEVDLNANTIVTGYVSSTLGFRINGAAPAGKFLRGDGSNFVSSNIVLSDLPSQVVTETTLATVSGNILSQVASTYVSQTDLNLTASGNTVYLDCGSFV